MPDARALQALKTEFETELLESVIPFWERHSPDRAHGGYFNHLDRAGRVYDPTKNVWLQARQVWMFSKLYNDVEQHPRWLDLGLTTASATELTEGSMPGAIGYTTGSTPAGTVSTNDSMLAAIV